MCSGDHGRGIVVIDDDYLRLIYIDRLRSGRFCPKNSWSKKSLIVSVTEHDIHKLFAERNINDKYTETDVYEKK